MVEVRVVDVNLIRVNPDNWAWDIFNRRKVALGSISKKHLPYLSCIRFIS